MRRGILFLAAAVFLGAAGDLRAEQRPGAVFEETFEAPFTDEVLIRIAPQMGDHRREGDRVNLLPPGWWPLNSQVGSGRLWSASAETRPGSKGKQSARVENVGGTPQTGLMYPGWGDGRLRLKKGERYRFTMWYRSNVPIILNAWNDGKMTDLRKQPFPEEFRPFRDLGADWAGNIFHEIIPPSAEWAKGSFLFTAPADYEREKVERSTIDIQLAAQREGWMVIDDVTIARTSEREKPGRASERQAPEEGERRTGNLLTNASFEAGLRGGWRVVEQRDFRAPVDSEIAYHGVRSVRLDLPCFEDRIHAPGGRLRNTVLSSLVRLAPGRTYTFSAYAKTSGPEGPNVKISVFGCEVPDSGEPIASARLASTGEWQRGEVSFEAPPMPHDSYFVSVDVWSVKPGSVWLDALQLEEGESAGEFQPGEAVAFGLSTTQEGNLFLTTEPFETTLLIANEGSEIRDFTYTVRIVNIRDEEIWSRRESVDALPAGVTERMVRPDKAFTGVFRMEVLDRDGRLGEEMIGGIVPPPRDDVALDESSMGCHISLEPALMRVTRRYGMRWIRLHDTLPNTRWEYVEIEKGRWVWDDDKMKVALDMGFGLLGTLHTYSYQEWGSRLWFYDAARKDTFFISPEGFEGYCFEAVNHYKDLIHYWGFFNEIGGATGSAADGVVDLLQRAQRAMRKADPEAKLTGCDFFPSHEQGFQEILKRGLLPLLDVCTLHYFNAVGPETIRRFVELGRSDGVERPVWVCEENSLGKPIRAWYRREKPYLVDSTVRRNADYGGQQIEAYQAAVDDLKMYVTERSCGVSRRFYYMNWPSRTAALTISYSDFEYDNAVGPLHVTQGVYAHLLDGTRFAETVDLGRSLRGHLFERGGETIACLWTAPGARHGRGFNAPAGKVRVLDFQGNELASAEGTAGLTMTFSEEPVFLVAEGLSAKALSEILRAGAQSDLSAEIAAAGGRCTVRLRVANHGSAEYQASARARALSGAWELGDAVALAAGPRSEGKFDIPIRKLPDEPGLYALAVEVEHGGETREITLRFPLLVAHAFDAPPTIDGRLDEWHGMAPARIDTAEQAKLFGTADWRGLEDSSARVRAGWTLGKLYLAVEVTDDKLVQRNRTYLDDCVELFFNTNLADRTDRRYGPNAYQVVLPPVMDERSEKTVEINPTGGATLTAQNVEYASQKTAEGYAVEVGIDVSALADLELTEGTLIGFDVAVDDCDDGMRKAQLIWAGDEDDCQDTGDFGYLLLAR
ncbi:MAG: sugar-binding protein [Planctomycetota bacterium]